MSREQNKAGIDVKQRILIQELEAPTEAAPTGGGGIGLPVLAMLAILTAFGAGAIMLDRLYPRARGRGRRRRPRSVERQERRAQARPARRHLRDRLAPPGARSGIAHPARRGAAPGTTRRRGARRRGLRDQRRAQPGDRHRRCRRVRRAPSCSRCARRIKPIVTWPNAIVCLVLVIWLIPIRLYRLPVGLPFNLEPYRIAVLLLIFGLILGVMAGHLPADRGGHGRALLALGGVAFASQAVNWSTPRHPGPAAGGLQDALVLRQLRRDLHAHRRGDPTLRGREADHFRPRHRGRDRGGRCHDRVPDAVEPVREPRQLDPRAREEPPRGARAARRKAPRTRVGAAPDRPRRRPDDVSYRSPSCSPSTRRRRLASSCGSQRQRSAPWARSSPCPARWW